MPLPSPNLDNRGFQQLLDECVQRVKRRCPEWNDLSPGDPGIVLLELYAHLTEVMIYRLNRIPDKAFIEFLRLMGVKLLPPAAAVVKLKFTLNRPMERGVEIPRGTRVTVGRAGGATEPPIFATSATAVLPAGQTEIEVLAYHVELVDGELVGQGSGLPGLSLSVARPPIVAPAGDELDLLVGVEVSSEERVSRAQDLKFIEHAGKTFRIWREVDDFANQGPDGFVYVADRMSGVITFAPALHGRAKQGRQEERAKALAEVPPAGREIRVWYRRGGGAAGNIGSNQLTQLKDPPGRLSWTVTNPEPAKGGSSAESLDNALVRGPQELHTLERAVTAADFKRIALETSAAVKRARAFTKAALWKHAAPGTVEVLLVPDVPPEQRVLGRVTPAQLLEQQSDTVRDLIATEANERSPLGTCCLVDWVRCKEVRVKARVVIHREENPQAVRDRVMRRLYETICPLPGAEPGAAGWRFGRPLRCSDIYDLVFGEPGVSYADQVRLLVDDVPEKEITALAADPFQPRTWHVTAGEKFYRSLNDGAGWERSGHFPGEKINLLRPAPDRAGLMASVSELAGNEAGCVVRISRDCGENWTVVARPAYAVHDAAWLTRPSGAVLLLASDKGLFELALEPGAVPVPILVDPQRQDLGFYAVAVSTNVRGEPAVAVAAIGSEGVFLSDRAGTTGTFRLGGLRGEDVRALEVQALGPRRFLWAGVTVAGFEPGKGCFRRELFTGQEDWTAFHSGWDGGSCLSVAFVDSTVLAATHHAGVLLLDSSREGAEAAWQRPDVNCGLPMRDLNRFQRVAALATSPDGKSFLGGGPAGIFRSADAGKSYQNCSQKEFGEQVTLPETWLFCSGEHELNIVSEDETQRD